MRLYTVEKGQAQELAYDSAMFDYSRSGVDGRKLPANLGFAGFRLLFHTDWVRDVAAFQGASYFRAVDGDMQYGMSQRGLAMDSGVPAFRRSFRISSPITWSVRPRIRVG